MISLLIPKNYKRFFLKGGGGLNPLFPYHFQLETLPAIDTLCHNTAGVSLSPHTYTMRHITTLNTMHTKWDNLALVNPIHSGTSDG
jgi:hypothetical protein